MSEIRILLTSKPAKRGTNRVGDVRGLVTKLPEKDINMVYTDS
jgi:hypothetical protein